jgi:hypothetical protein
MLLAALRRLVGLVTLGELVAFVKGRERVQS